MKVNNKINYNGTYYYNHFIFNEESIKFLINNLDKSNFWLKNKLNISWESIQEFREYNSKPTEELEYLLNNKLCTKCKLIKNISNFRIRNDKINSACKKCDNYKKPKDKTIKETVLLSSPNKRMFVEEYIYYSNLNENVALGLYFALKEFNIEQTANLFNLKYYTVKNFHNMINYKDKLHLEKLYLNNTTKQCKRCLEIKPLNQFFKHENYTKVCLLCKSKKRYYSDKYTEKEKKLNRLPKTPEQKFRKLISSSILKMLKKRNSKKESSILKHLGYSINDLIKHIESQFDERMNWDNHGLYNKEKFSWQLDHIKCHSDYPYTSMNDENFKIVWSLNNLRPLEAKINIIEGSNRTRHK